MFNVLRFTALCNKHVGFGEEKEWRLIAIAKQHTNDKNILIKHEIETIKGIPQNIIKIKLNNDLLKNMIHKVIIGPCIYPLIIRSSIATELLKIGITNPEEIIHISNVPLRTNIN